MVPCPHDIHARPEGRARNDTNKRANPSRPICDANSSSGNNGRGNGRASAGAVQDRQLVLPRPSPINVRFTFLDLRRPLRPQPIKHTHQRSVYIPPPPSSLTLHGIPVSPRARSPAHRLDPNAQIFASVTASLTASDHQMWRCETSTAIRCRCLFVPVPWSEPGTIATRHPGPPGHGSRTATRGTVDSPLVSHQRVRISIS